MNECLPVTMSSSVTIVRESLVEPDGISVSQKDEVEVNISVTPTVTASHSIRSLLHSSDSEQQRVQEPKSDGGAVEQGKDPPSSSALQI